MRRSYTLVAGLVALAASAEIGRAADDIVVTGAWARPSAGEMGMSALYLTLKNSGLQPDELVSVTTPVAGMSHMHATRIENGIASMRPLEHLELPPGQAVRFEPKGNHVMLMMLAHPLVVGQRIPVELHFKSHAAQTVEAIVAVTAPE